MAPDPTWTRSPCPHSRFGDYSYNTSSWICALPIPNIAGSRKQYWSFIPATTPHHSRYPGCSSLGRFLVDPKYARRYAPNKAPLKYSALRNVFDCDCLLFLRASQAESRASNQLCLLKAKRKASKPERAFREFDVHRQGEVRHRF